jgi:hypothetical protein
MSRTIFALGQARSLGLAGCLLFCLSGCVTNDLSMATFETASEPQLPPVSLFYLRANADFTRACNDFDRASVFNHCQQNSYDIYDLGQALQEASVFENVEIANKIQPYSIAVATAHFDTETAREIGGAAVAGASLMLLPMSVSAALEVKAHVLWRGAPIHEFQTQIPYTLRGSLLNLGKDHQYELMRSVASHLIADVQESGALSGSFLRSKLKTSDYEATLSGPERLGAFDRGALYIYSDPLAGAQLRYHHREYDGGHLDVFVYPIMNDRFEDQALLTAQMQVQQRDLEVLQAQAQLTELAMGEAVTWLPASKDRQSSVLKASGTYRLSDQEVVDSRTYLFRLQDKFVKVRTTFGRFAPVGRDIDAFVRRLPQALAVPEESRFMAGLRQRWQDERRQQTVQVANKEASPSEAAAR